MTPITLFPDWMSSLTLQQQAVLVTAIRGWDGDDKHTPMKIIVRALRASVMKAAHYGRELEIGEHAGDYMSLREFENFQNWQIRMTEFVEFQSDKVNLHAYTHLMHAAEILGYKHPRTDFRSRWSLCYAMMADRLHLNMETEGEMDMRLSDYSRWKWDPEVPDPHAERQEA